MRLSSLILSTFVTISPLVCLAADYADNRNINPSSAQIGISYLAGYTGHTTIDPSRLRNHIIQVNYLAGYPGLTRNFNGHAPVVQLSHAFEIHDYSSTAVRLTSSSRKSVKKSKAQKSRGKLKNRN